MCDKSETTQFLARVPLFQNLKKRQLQSLSKRLVERNYNADHAIVTQGKGGEGFFIIVSGQTKVLRTRADGSQVEVNAFGPSDFFGELALLDDGPRTASVITTEPRRRRWLVASTYRTYTTTSRTCFATRTRPSLPCARQTTCMRFT